MHRTIVTASEYDQKKEKTTTGQQLKLSLIIPAYNEEGGIGQVLQELGQILAQPHWLYEVIVIDDGSQDNTALVAQQHPWVRVISHKANKGYGAALKTGIRSACYPLICITDADGTYPNERIPDLINRLVEEHLDMVVGARTGVKVHIPLIRRPAKWTINQLANFVAGESIPDLNSGLRVFRREVAIKMLGIFPDGFSFTTTITLAMISNSYLVDYVPINYHTRVGRSKIKPIRDTLNFIQLILRMALYFAPLKIFIPLSIFLLLTATGWALFTKFVWGNLADESTITLLIAAVQTASIGLLAELVNHRFAND